MTAFLDPDGRFAAATPPARSPTPTTAVPTASPTSRAPRGGLHQTSSTRTLCRPRPRRGEERHKVVVAELLGSRCGCDAVGGGCSPTRAGRAGRRAGGVVKSGGGALPRACWRSRPGPALAGRARGRRVPEVLALADRPPRSWSWSGSDRPTPGDPAPTWAGAWPCCTPPGRRASVGTGRLHRLAPPAQRRRPDSWPEFLVQPAGSAPDPPGGRRRGAAASAGPRLDRLAARVNDRAGPPSRRPGPRRPVSGNVLHRGRREPWIIDPAAYGGHREVDLAMFDLFGHPSDAFHAAYPGGRAAGRRLARPPRPLQLRTHAVHTNLFGAPTPPDPDPPPHPH